MKTILMYRAVGLVVHAVRLVVAMAMLGGINSVFGRVVDDFDDGNKAGWEDFTFGANLGEIKEENGQFSIKVPQVGQSLFAASTKTTESFALQDGQTVEFRVDLISTAHADSFAVLSWIPEDASVSALEGYSMAISSSDVLLTKGLDKYFHNEATPLDVENVTMVLSMTGQGESVLLHVRLLDKDAGDAVLWEASYVDTAGADVLADGTDSPAASYIGRSGNFVLLCFYDEGGGPSDALAIYDNAEAFVLQNDVLDDFEDGVKTNWEDFTFGPTLGEIKEENGQYSIKVPQVGQSLFAASTKTSPAFKLEDGERVEFRVDLVSTAHSDSFAVLSWISEDASVSALEGYSMALSSGDVLVTKGLDKYFYNEAVPLDVENVTMVLALTGKGDSVILRGELLDRENGNAVLWETTQVDTSGADTLADGEDSPAGSYIGKSGNFVLLCFYDEGEGPSDALVIYDNARVAFPAGIENQPPFIGQIRPGFGRNYVGADSAVTFAVTDDSDIPEGGVKLELNGETYTETSGLVRAGTEYRFEGLVADKDYAGKVQATDADGAVRTAMLRFDTFTETVRVIEAEDFNYFAGLWYEDPVVVPEGTAFWDNYYHNASGVQEVDYLETEEIPQSGESVYRPDDPVGTGRALDFVREKFAEAGGSAAGVYDYSVQQIVEGEWLNYTRTFPEEGSYKVYLRQALFNMNRSVTDLKRVLAPAGEANQPTQPLGSFIGNKTGVDFVNVPLTDGVGLEEVVIRLSGVETVRLEQRTTDPSGTYFEQNYLAFVRVEDPGKLRPLVAEAFPTHGQVVSGVDLEIRVFIANRETAVVASSVSLEVGGTAAAAAVEEVEGGVRVAYVPEALPKPNEVVDVSLRFEDDEGVGQTVEWNFSADYLFLSSGLRSGGSGSDAGLVVRVVQAPADHEFSMDRDSIQRAEEQLKPGSSIPVEATVTADVLLVNFNQDEGGAAGFFDGDAVIPGLGSHSDNIAMEVLAYLDLTAGVHRMGLVHDDGMRVQVADPEQAARLGSTVGASIGTGPGAGPGTGPVPAPPVVAPTPPTLAATSAGSTSDSQGLNLVGVNNNTTTEFSFVVEETGLYPFRVVWYENGGGAHVEWYSIDLASGDRILINDTADARAIAAYRTVTDAPAVVLESSATVDGVFEAEDPVEIDLGAGELRVQLRGATRFYRIQAGTSYHFTGIEVEGGGGAVLHIAPGAGE